MKDLRYDRQVRLWGDDGQLAIESTSICVLGSSALATEILKSLVLAGIESFCIVDDAIVAEPDLGTNFFVEESDVEKPRAEAAVRLLMELNPRVKGSFIVRSPSSTDAVDLNALSSYSVVVGTNLSESEASPISDFLFKSKTPFLLARVYGFLGLVRICVLEHPILNTHQENEPPDLRIARPFPAFLQHINSIRMDEMSDEQVRHTPYVILYAEALKHYRASLEDPHAFPDSYAKRKEFLKFVLDLQREREQGGIDENFDQAKNSLTRSLLPTRVPDSVQEVLKQEKCGEKRRGDGEPFWVMCTALRRFVERHDGVLPLSGQLPDMASDSASYARLATIYHEKALQDAKEVLEDVRRIERDNEDRMVEEANDDANEDDDIEMQSAESSSSSSVAPPPISKEACMRFCKNASVIDLQRGSPLSSQVGPTFKKVLTSMVWETEEEGVKPSVWLLLLRAVDRFREEKSRYPGTNGIPCEIDAFDLKKRVTSVVKDTMQEREEGEEDMGDEGVSDEDVLKKVTEGAVQEMCRYAACEIHGVAALVGGIAAQEVIKLATRQYLPVDNTLVYDAHTQSSQTFRL